MGLVEAAKICRDVDGFRVVARVSGAVVWAQVTDRQSEGRHGPSYWEGVLTYSYTVPAQELEVGEYRKKFYDEEQAEEWSRGLRDSFVDIRVDPADVKRSVWQEQPVFTQPALPQGRISRSDAIEAEGLGIREIAAILVLCASVVGAFIALWFELSCFRGDRRLQRKGIQDIFSMPSARCSAASHLKCFFLKSRVRCLFRRRAGGNLIRTTQ